MEHIVLQEIQELRAQNEEVLRRMDVFREMLEVSLRPRSQPGRRGPRNDAPHRVGLPLSGRSSSDPLQVIDEAVTQARTLPEGRSSSTGLETLAEAPRMQVPSLRSVSSEVLAEVLPVNPVGVIRSEQQSPGVEAWSQREVLPAQPIAGRHPTLLSETANSDPRSFNVQDFHEAVLRRLVNERRDQSKEAPSSPPLLAFEHVVPSRVEEPGQGSRVRSQSQESPPMLVALHSLGAENSPQAVPAGGAGVQLEATPAEANPRSEVPYFVSGGTSKQKRRGRVAWDEQVQAVDAVFSRPSQGEGTRMGQALPLSSRSSIDNMRRHVEEEIVKTRSVSKLPNADEQANDSKCARLLGGGLGCLAHGSKWALRVGGLLPWSMKRYWPSVGYQWVVLLVNVGILCGLAMETHYGLSIGANQAFFVGDLVLAAGSVAGLLALGTTTGSARLQESLAELEEANERQSFKSVVEAGNGIDSLLTLAAWLAFLADRLCATYVLSSVGLPQISTLEALRVAAVIITSAQLALLVLAVLRLIRNMTGLVNGFCLKFLEGMDFSSAPCEWNTVQASLRLASSAVERVYAILLSVLVLLGLAIAVDLHPLHSAAWAIIASVSLILMTAQILLRAASVTDACVRISQLVNATGVNDEPMDMERKYLVEYIAASEAGFYVFNIRLGAGFAIKVFHYTGLMAFTLARLVLPSGSPF